MITLLSTKATHSDGGIETMILLAKLFIVQHPSYSANVTPRITPLVSSKPPPFNHIISDLKPTTRTISKIRQLQHLYPSVPELLNAAQSEA